MIIIIKIIIKIMIIITKTTFKNILKRVLLTNVSWVKIFIKFIQKIGVRKY